ncbi:MAG: hypothetical protein M1819_006215 [Sarea resinae]|nr:MAG: hypothetical protein M1819_006215 [Sarea resinae]
MHSLSHVAFVSAVLATFAVASPVQKRSSFTVNQQFNKAVTRNGPAEMARTYRKYNKPMPEDVANAAAASGSVTATPETDDSEYLCPVSIGGQTLNLDFDTGSSDLWVFSTELSSSEQSGHSVYNPSKSSTSKLMSGETWDISYGDGSGASGNVYSDDVTVGGLTVDGQAVEAAKQISSEFTSDTDSDGLLGLGFSSINTVTPDQQQTFFENALSQLGSPVFTASLKYHAAGSYDFGVIDSSKYTGSITYTDVDNSEGYWGFTSSGYAVGSGSFHSTSISTIADTGTTLLYAPTSVVKAYYNQVSGSSYSSNDGGYIFPCDASLPSFTVGIGSYHAVVPGDYINYSSNGDGTCFGGIQENTNIGMSIYGDIFLKSQFVVFDNSGPKIGFAAQAS